MLMIISSFLFWIILITLIVRINKSIKRKRAFKEADFKEADSEYRDAMSKLNYYIKYPSSEDGRAEGAIEKMRSMNERLRKYKQNHTKEINQMEAEWKAAKFTYDYDKAKKDLLFSTEHPGSPEKKAKEAIKKLRSLNEKYRSNKQDHTTEIDRMEKDWEEANAAYKKKTADEARDSRLKYIDECSYQIRKEIGEIEVDQKKLLSLSLESLSTYPTDLDGYRMDSMIKSWENMLMSTKELAKMIPPVDCSKDLAYEAMVVLSALVSNQLFYRGTGKDSYYPEAFMEKLREGFADMASIDPAYGEAAKTGPYDYEQYWKRLTDFEANATEAARHGMMLPDTYGQVDPEFLAAAQAMTRREAKATIAQFEAARRDLSLEAITALDPRKLLLALWFFAMEKPYHAKDLTDAQLCCMWFFDGKCPDAKLAEWYAQRQLGGPDAITRVDNKEFEKASAMMAEHWASGLMWLQGYRQEQDILQKMLEAKLPMSPKAQERLHALNNGGGNAPDTHQAVSTGDQLFFDVSALTWKEAEYNSLFENLAFQDKKLTYGLAVRDEDKDLLLPAGVSLPGKEALLAKFQADFNDEYGDQASARGVELVILSGSGEEHMEGILAASTECRQLGIAAHMARIGKKVNIKFYTLFLPEGLELAAQKQQALSLSCKLNPTVSMWENGLKTSMLTSIQQLLNSSVQGSGQPEAPLPQSDAKPEEPVF